MSSFKQRDWYGKRQRGTYVNSTSRKRRQDIRGNIYCRHRHENVKKIINHLKYINQDIFDDFTAEADNIEKGVRNSAYLVVNFLTTVVGSLTATTNGRKISSSSMHDGGEGMIAWVAPSMADVLSGQKAQRSSLSKWAVVSPKRPVLHGKLAC